MDKTSGSGPEDWGFESLWAHRDFKERCQSGLMSTLGKRVYPITVPGVRIPLSPPLSFYVTPKMINSTGFEIGRIIVKQAELA